MEGEQRNVLGGPLQPCSRQPLTGFYRTACCHLGAADGPEGHAVCVLITQEFLEHELAHDNDLVTPDANEGFPGLKPGDRWCVCTDVWLKALEDDVAPPVCLEATNEKALQLVPLEILRETTVDPVASDPVQTADKTRLTAASQRSPGAATGVIVRILVSDMDASLAFYTDKLGFKLDWDWGDPITDAGLHFGELSVQLELAPGGAGTDWNPGIRVLVEDVDALYTEHCRQGVITSHPPLNRPWHLREYNVADPNGFRFCFCQDVDDSQALWDEQGQS